MFPKSHTSLLVRCTWYRVHRLQLSHFYEPSSHFHIPLFRPKPRFYSTPRGSPRRYSTDILKDLCQWTPSSLVTGFFLLLASVPWSTSPPVLLCLLFCFFLFIFYFLKLFFYTALDFFLPILNQVSSWPKFFFSKSATLFWFFLVSIIFFYCFYALYIMLILFLISFATDLSFTSRDLQCSFDFL